MSRDLKIDFARTVAPLANARIGYAWKGYGSAIFLELGELTPSNDGGHPKGQWSIGIEWDWRVESDENVLFGSSNSGPEIERYVRRLKGTTVVSVSAWGTIPELCIELLGKAPFRLRTASMLEGDPQWSIRIGSSHWLYVADGAYVLGPGESMTTPEDTAACDTSSEIASRWSTPIAEPAVGTCRKCAFFFHIDGPYHLLDYGVCTSQNSVFDRTAVRVDSGCPEFHAKDGG